MPFARVLRSTLTALTTFSWSACARALVSQVHQYFPLQIRGITERSAIKAGSFNDLIGTSLMVSRDKIVHRFALDNLRREIFIKGTRARACAREDNIHCRKSEPVSSVIFYTLIARAVTINQNFTHVFEIIQLFAYVTTSVPVISRLPKDARYAPCHGYRSSALSFSFFQPGTEQLAST